MNESYYTRQVNDRVEGLGIAVWKISDKYHSGIPDCLYQYKEGKNFWLEVKFDQKFPKTIKLHKKLTALQQRWIKKRLAMGHQVAVLYGSREGGIVFEQLEWATDIKTSTRTILSYNEIVEWIAQKVGCTINKD